MSEDTLLIITPQLALAAMLFVLGWMESHAARRGRSKLTSAPAPPMWGPTDRPSASRPTQVYFTEKQHRALSERAADEGKSMAELVRDAVDAYLATPDDFEQVVSDTFATAPDFEVPPRSTDDRDV